AGTEGGAGRQCGDRGRMPGTPVAPQAAGTGRAGAQGRALPAGNPSGLFRVLRGRLPVPDRGVPEPGDGMIELIDTFPDVQVQSAEYARLLGYPPGVEWSDRANELASWARNWYMRRGRPWVYARQAESLELAGPLITIEGVRFSS